MVYVSLECFRHYPMYLPDFEILGWDSWICQNLDTLDEVFRRPLAGLVCARKTFHRHKSIEDYTVRAGEPSPLIGRLVP